MKKLAAGMYEIELHAASGRTEVRLSDHLPRFLKGQELVFAGRHWRIVRESRPQLPQAKARIICVPAMAEESS